MSASVAQTSGKLRRLFASQPATADHKLSIVCIPDAAMLISRSPSRGSWQWLQEISVSTPNAQVLEFTYGLDGEGESIWRWFDIAGDILRNCIIDDGKSFNLFGSRILFVCHALGGIILKRAFMNLNKDKLVPENQQLLNLVSGLVFLGTPHPTWSRRQDWSLLSPNLKFSLNVSSTLLAQAEMEANAAASISQKFQECGIEAPVISAFEQRKTKVRGGWAPFRKKLLVHRDLAETNLTNESLIGIDADHATIMLPPRNGPLYDKILDMARQASRQPIQPPGSGVHAGSSGNRAQWADTESYVPSVTDREHRTSGREPALGLTDSSSYQKVSTLDDFAPRPREPKLPCYKVDTVLSSEEFLGRQEILSEIDTALLPQESHSSESKPKRLRSFALCGMGGVGKTQIAIHFALSRKEQFDAVFWIQADNREKLDRDMSQIAAHLKLTDDTEAEDQVVSRNVAIAWLSNPRKGPAPVSIIDGDFPSQRPHAKWLIIFDNADSPEILRDDWLMGTNGSILITSRDPAAKTRLHFNHGLDVDGLGNEDAASLLRTLTGSTDAPQVVDGSFALAKRLGGLPLGINQAAALMLRRGDSFRGFLQYYELEENIADLVKNHPGKQFDHYNHTLFTTWALESLDAEALALLNILSLLDPDRIDEFVLLMEDSSELLALGFPNTNKTLDAARTTLYTCSLITRHPDQEFLTIHRLIQDVARSRLSPSQYKDTYEMALTLLTHAWPEREHFSHDTSTWEISDRIVLHASNLQDLYLKKKGWELEVTSRRRLAHLIQVTGWHFLERGDYRAAEPHFDFALSICRESPDEMLDVLADVLKSLHTLYTDTRKDPALTLRTSEQHYELRVRLNNKSQFAIDSLAMAHGDLGEAYMIMGRYEESIKHCKESQDIDFKQPDIIAGLGWPQFAFIHEAWSLLGLGLYSDAVERMERTMAFRRRRYGLNEPPALRLGLQLLIMGNARAKQGRLEESLEAHEKALANFKGTVGTKHLRTCQVYVKLGEHHARMGNFEVASKYFDDALKGFESHPYYTKELARVNFIIGQQHLSEDDPVGAAQPMQKAKTLYQALVPTFDMSSPLCKDDFDALVDITSR